MDISAFRQMVEKPEGFLGRYGLGNKILQEGGLERRRQSTSRSPRSWTHDTSPRTSRWGALDETGKRGRQTGLEGRDRCSRCPVGRMAV